MPHAEKDMSSTMTNGDKPSFQTLGVSEHVKRPNINHGRTVLTWLLNSTSSRIP